MDRSFLTIFGQTSWTDHFSSRSGFAFRWRPSQWSQCRRLLHPSHFLGCGTASMGDSPTAQDPRNAA